LNAFPGSSKRCLGGVDVIGGIIITFDGLPGGPAQAFDSPAPALTPCRLSKPSTRLTKAKVSCGKYLRHVDSPRPSRLCRAVKSVKGALAASGLLALASAALYSMKTKSGRGGGDCPGNLGDLHPDLGFKAGVGALTQPGS